MRFVYWLGIALFWQTGLVLAQADTLINQLIRIEPGANNRLTQRTYGLGQTPRRTYQVWRADWPVAIRYVAAIYRKNVGSI
jgi:hypothetical protein